MARFQPHGPRTDVRAFEMPDQLKFSILKTAMQEHRLDLHGFTRENVAAVVFEEKLCRAEVAEIRERLERFEAGDILLAVGPHPPVEKTLVSFEGSKRSVGQVAHHRGIRVRAAQSTCE